MTQERIRKSRGWRTLIAALSTSLTGPPLSRCSPWPKTSVDSSFTRDHEKSFDYDKFSRDWEWHCFPSECPLDYVSQTFRYFPSSDQTPWEELPFTWVGPTWQSSAKENSSWDMLADGDDMESAEVLVTSSPSASTCLLKLCNVPSVCCFPLINTSACFDIQRRSCAWKC